MFLIVKLIIVDLSNNNLKPAHVASLSTLVNLKDFNLSNNSLSPDDANILSDSPLPDNYPSDNQSLSLKVPSLQPRSTSPTFSSQKRKTSNPPTPRSPLSQSSVSENISDNDNNDNNDNTANLSSISENDNIDESPSTEPLTNDSFANEQISTNESFSTETNEIQTKERSSSIPPLILTNNSTSNTTTRSRSPSPSLPSTASSTTPSASPVPSPSHSPVPFSRPPLPLSHYIHLEILNLSGNNLRVFPDVFSIVSLVKLDLSNNKIVEIPTGIHTQLVNLKEFNLQSYPQNGVLFLFFYFVFLPQIFYF